MKRDTTPSFGDDGSIYLTFYIPGVSFEEMVCWLQKNTTFDRIKRAPSVYQIWIPPPKQPDKEDAFKEYKEKFSSYLSNTVRVYYRLKGNRQIIDEDISCP